MVGLKVLIALLFATVASAQSISRPGIILHDATVTTHGFIASEIDGAKIRGGYLLIKITALEGTANTLQFYLQAFNDGNEAWQTIAIGTAYSSTGTYELCIGMPLCASGEMSSTEEWGTPFPKRSRIGWFVKPSEIGEDVTFQMTLVPY